jgi:serine phosphatase RsbU (regulator of sigma subunit)
MKRNSLRRFLPELPLALRSEGRRGSVGVPARDPDRLPGPRDEQGWLLLMFLLATGLAVLDAVATDVVLVGLFMLPALFAALRAGPVGTALIGAYCVALGVDAGAWDDFLFSLDHIVHLVVLIAAATTAVWIAELRLRNVAARRAAVILAETGTLIEDMLAEQAVTEHVVEFAIPELASLCIIDIVGDDGSIGPVAIAAERPDAAALFREMRETYPLDPARDHPIVRAIKGGETVVIPDIPDSMLRSIAPDPGHFEAIREIGFRSALIVPLRVGGQTIGSFELISTAMPDRYGPGEIAIAEELARRAAIGIRNARLHEQEARVARTLQRSLLPNRLPDVPGFDVAARFRPQGTAVGGDFYDLFQVNGGWVAAMGDVCGKGPEAAALTSLTRYTLRTAALQANSPCEVLKVLNSALIAEPDQSRGRFCTAAYTKLIPGPTGVEVAACSGGHPHPLVLRASGEVEGLTQSGTLLGVFPEPSLADVSNELTKGDSLIFYTDGVVELRSPEGPPLLPLEEIVAGCAGLSATAIAERIELAALAEHGDAPMDDMALLVLRYIG